MGPSLPNDLLHMICGSLSEMKEFDTLYNCALSSKQFAIPALSALYRICHAAPVTGSNTDELEHSTGRMTMKWACMWRSILLSCLGQTYFPYSQFIRVLAFENLHELFGDNQFQNTARIRNALFAGNLADYKVDRAITANSKKKSFNSFDTEATVNKFAKAIMPNVPMLEELRGPTQFFDISTVADNISRLSNFQSLNIFHGEQLTGMGSLFGQYCQHFSSLDVYGWSHPQSDEICAKFLSELRPNSLKSFGARSLGNCNTETYLALNRHRESLETLQLEAIQANAMPGLALLSGCTNLKTLTLVENAPPVQDLKERHNEAFLEIIAWLCQCKNLRHLHLKNFLNAMSLLTPVLVESNIELVTLTLDGYRIIESTSFHQALGFQSSLERLFLRGDLEDEIVDEENLIASLNKLKNLKELQMRDVSDNMITEDFLRLLPNLSKLEKLGITADSLQDEIWDALAFLPSLQSLELNAQSNFSARSILYFIKNLGAANHKLQLNVNMQENDAEISEADQATIEKAIAAKVDGKFSLTYFKDPDADDYSVASD